MIRLLFASMVLLPPLRGQISVRGDAANMRQQLRQLALGQPFLLTDLPLLAPGDALQLQGFQVWATDAVIVVHTDRGEQRMAPPDHRYFAGSLSGLPAARAFLRLHEDGSVFGLVNWQNRFWLLSQGSEALEVRELSHEERTSLPPFACQADGLPAPSANLTTPNHPSGAAFSQGGAGTYNVTVAAESDFEYYNKFGNASAASDYMADLIGFASSIYAAELDTNMLLGHVSLWSTSADPWVQTAPNCGLYEFGQYWNTNNTGIARTTAHFFSGKSTNAGIAWVGVLCSGAFSTDSGGCLSPSSGNYGGAYGYTGGLDANFNPNAPTVVWDIVAVTHEIGHNFNSPHTHCYGGLGGNPNPVDQCYGSQSGSGCFSGTGVLPCGTPGGGCGTIMSYCHLLSGGMANITLTLGLGHGWGVAPERVPARMNAHVVARAGANPSCISSCAAPNITASSGDLTRCPGQSATFSVSASGSGLSYQWRKNGVPIGGATASSYTIASVAGGDAATYSCVVSNGCGSDTSNGMVLTVPTETQIQSQSGNLNLCTGQAALFSVTAVGSSLSYQWRKNASPIGGATFASYSIAAVSAGDAGSYDCLVSGSCGSLGSTPAILTVQQGVSIVDQPVSLLRCPGQSASFSVNASGTSPAYQWRKNGLPIGGATSSSFTLPSVVAGDAGAYSCQVSNSCSTVVSTSANLTVDAAVTLLSMSGDVVACVGDLAFFSVSASGTGLSYQWQKDGSDLPGETNAVLTFNPVEAGDDGDYRCEIEGSCGSVLSDPRSLTVTAGSFSVTAGTSQRVQGLEEIVLTGSVTCGGSQLSFEWFNLTSGGGYGPGNNPVTLPSLLSQSTLFELQADNGISTLSDQARVLASANAAFRDLDGDGCNDLDDLLFLLPHWRLAGAALDADGNLLVEVLDFLYINSEGGCP